MPEWYIEGRLWQKKRDIRLQHVLSHMNHHIHPKKDVLSGDEWCMSGMCSVCQYVTFDINIGPCPGDLRCKHNG